jgi:prepilin signal peptidase PulO-like enzyme (type II secretory pathway)
MGLGDAKLAASIGLVLAWGSWSELFLGALAGALLGAAYARVLSARRGPAGPVYLPLGPFLLAGAFVAIALLPLRSSAPAPRLHTPWRKNGVNGVDAIRLLAP